MYQHLCQPFLFVLIADVTAAAQLHRDMTTEPAQMTS